MGGPRARGPRRTALGQRVAHRPGRIGGPPARGRTGSDRSERADDVAHGPGWRTPERGPRDRRAGPDLGRVVGSRHPARGHRRPVRRAHADGDAAVRAVGRYGQRSRGRGRYPHLRSYDRRSACTRNPRGSGRDVGGPRRPRRRDDDRGTQPVGSDLVRESDSGRRSLHRHVPFEVDGRGRVGARGCVDRHRARAQLGHRGRLPRRRAPLASRRVGDFGCAPGDPGRQGSTRERGRFGRLADRSGRRGESGRPRPPRKAVRVRGLVRQPARFGDPRRVGPASDGSHGPQGDRCACRRTGPGRPHAPGPLPARGRDGEAFGIRRRPRHRAALRQVGLRDAVVRGRHAVAGHRGRGATAPLDHSRWAHSDRRDVRRTLANSERAHRRPGQRIDDR